MDSSFFPLANVVVVMGLILTAAIQPYKSSVAYYTKIGAITTVGYFSLPMHEHHCRNKQTLL